MVTPILPGGIKAVKAMTGRKSMVNSQLGQRCTDRHATRIQWTAVVRLSVLLVVSLLTGACASTGAVPRPFPLPGSASPEPATTAPAAGPTGAVDGYSVSSTALSLRGVPYRNGGSDPQGFDCSGFIQYVYRQHGVRVPRDVRQQFEVGRDVDVKALEPGDLVFFTTVAPGASHVGIVIGGDQFVHAPSSAGVVRVENLSSQYWARRFVGAKRVN
jgi:cell wall-associated NlpC family hydrolase